MLTGTFGEHSRARSRRKTRDRPCIPTPTHIFTSLAHTYPLAPGPRPEAVNHGRLRPQYHLDQEYLPPELQRRPCPLVLRKCAVRHWHRSPCMQLCKLTRGEGTRRQPAQDERERQGPKRKNWLVVFHLLGAVGRDEMIWDGRIPAGVWVGQLRRKKDPASTRSVRSVSNRATCIDIIAFTT